MIADRSRRWLAAPVLCGALWPTTGAAMVGRSAAPAVLPAPSLLRLDPVVAEQNEASRRTAEQALISESHIGEPSIGHSPIDRSLSGDHPNAAAALAEFAQTLHAYELHGAAAQAYELALEGALAPNAGAGLAWRYLQARAYHALGDLRRAVAGYLGVLEGAPLDATARSWLAYAYYESGDSASAAGAARAARGLRPGDPAALARLRQIALGERRFDEAVELLAAALAASPEATRLHVPLALAYRGAGDRARAEENLARRGSVGVAPADPLVQALDARRRGSRSHLVRGRTAFAVGRYAEAAAEFRAALAAAPQDAAAHVNLASALAFLGDHATALELYRRALALEPENRDARFNLGSLLLRTGDAGSARRHLEAAASHPADVVAQLELARALAATDAHADAHALLAGLDAPNPVDYRVDLLRGELLLAQGLEAAALAVLRLGVARLPGSAPLRAALCRLLAAAPDRSLRDGERALALARELEGESASAEHAELRSLALAEIGHCREAELAADQALARLAGAAAQPSQLERWRRLLEGRATDCRPP